MCSTCGAAAACTAPASERVLRFADGTQRRARGAGSTRCRPQDLSAAARAVGADRGHQHPLQRHDRAARQVRPARRGVVPGRGQCRARRRAALPGAAAGAVRRLAPAVRCAAAVLRGAARELGIRWRPRRWTAAGRGCAMRSAVRWRPMAMRAWRSPSTSAIATTFIRTNKQDVGKRLARAARHVVFGEKISASGAAPSRREAQPWVACT